VARLELQVYRSDCASIVDVMAYGAERIALDRSSIAFVRSGYFTERNGRSGPIVDPNYAILGGEQECLLTSGSSHINTCTIIRPAGRSLSSAPRGPLLVSSNVFLMHTRLLRDARSGGRSLDANVASLLCEMQAHSEPLPPDSHSQLVNNIRRLVNDSLSKRITLDALARQFYVSPFTVSRVFHRETGVRLREYVVRLRLRRALNLLLHTRKTITTIAVEFGFYDEPHFSKAFHVEFGVSPDSVRK
jgi:AraC-like DNA-binding protein